MPGFEVVPKGNKGRYVDIRVEGVVICRIYLRKNKYFGLADDERADVIRKLFEDNRDLVLNGIK